MNKVTLPFLLCTLTLFLITPTSFAQEVKPSPCPQPKPCKPMTADEINSFFGQTTYPFKLSLRLRQTVWNTRLPLVVDAVFTNTTGQSVFIDLKSSFQFNGYLDDDPEKPGYRVVWKQEGKKFEAKREDYTEIPAGEKIVFSLTSLNVEDAPLVRGVRSWQHHRRGSYDFFIYYSSGSSSRMFANQWAGQAVSNTVKLKVR